MASLNSPFPPLIAPAYDIVLSDIEDEVSINTASVLGENSHVSSLLPAFSTPAPIAIYSMTNHVSWAQTLPLLHPQPHLFMASRGHFKHHTNAS